MNVSHGSTGLGRFDSRISNLPGSYRHPGVASDGVPGTGYGTRYDHFEVH